MTTGGKHFTGHIIINVQEVDVVGYVPHDAPTLPASVTTFYKAIEVSGEIPAGAEESFEEIVLEEALAVAMSKRQGD